MNEKDGRRGEIVLASRTLFAACGMPPPAVILAEGPSQWEETAAMAWEMATGGPGGPPWVHVLVAPALALSAGLAAAAGWAAGQVDPGMVDAASRAAFSVSAAGAFALLYSPAFAARSALKARWAGTVSRNGLSASEVDLRAPGPARILLALDAETVLRGGHPPPRDPSRPVRLGLMEANLASLPAPVSLAWVGDADPTFDSPCTASLWDLNNAVDEAIVVGNVVVATPRSNGPSRRAARPVGRLLQGCH